MRGACHDVGHRVGIIVRHGAITVEKVVEPDDSIRSAPGCLEAERDAIVREREFDVTQVRGATEIPRWMNPHVVKHDKRAVRLNLRPRFLWKKAAQPQHHAKPEILFNLESFMI